MVTRHPLALLALCLALGASPAAADHGVVRGEVKNNLGDTLRDAVLWLEGSPDRIPLNGAREYSLELPEGRHVLKATAFGYRIVRRVLEVHHGQVTQVDFVLNSLVHSKYVGSLRDGATGEGFPGQYEVLDTPLDPVRIGPSGNFVGYLPPGEYRLRFSSAGFYDEVVPARVPGPAIRVVLKPLPRTTRARRLFR